MKYKGLCIIVVGILTLYDRVSCSRSSENKLNLPSRKSSNHLVSKRNLAVFVEGGLIEEHQVLSDWRDWEKDSTNNTVQEIDSASFCRQEERDDG